MEAGKPQEARVPGPARAAARTGEVAEGPQDPGKQQTRLCRVPRGRRAGTRSPDTGVRSALAVPRGPCSALR